MGRVWCGRDLWMGYGVGVGVDGVWCGWEGNWTDSAPLGMLRHLHVLPPELMATFLLQ